MPDTPLTEILQDFRSYRPGNHREFLEWVKDRAEDVGVKHFALRERSSAGESLSFFLLLLPFNSIHVLINGISLPQHCIFRR